MGFMSWSEKLLFSPVKSSRMKPIYFLIETTGNNVLGKLEVHFFATWK